MTTLKMKQVNNMAKPNLFPEMRTEFIGFNAFFKTNILPYLEVREGERAFAFTKAVKICCGMLFLGFLVTMIAFMITHSWLSLAGMGFGLIIGCALAYPVLMKIWPEIKQFLMTSICDFIGWHFKIDGFLAPVLTKWLGNKLLPKYDRATFEDQMSGEVNGVKFQLCDALLESEMKGKSGQTHWRPVFRGKLMNIDTPQKFLGQTVVLRDKGVLNTNTVNGMKRVGLVDPAFESIFEAYSTDQVEARYLLTPDFMLKLTNLEASISGQKIRFGFFDKTLHIAIELPLEFENEMMFKPLTDTRAIQKMLNEIDAVFHVIESVSKTK